MSLQELHLLGSLQITRGLVSFRRCPLCEQSVEILAVDDAGVATCYRCQHSAPLDAFRKVQLRRTIATCAGCGADVPLTPSYAGAIGYLCPKCYNYVAVHYGNRRVPPQTALRVSWNRDVWARGQKVSDDCRFVRCRSGKDHLVVTLLQVLAKQEQSGFLFGEQSEHEAGLLLRRSNGRRYVGYLIWTKEDHSIVRQIFVKPEERRQGLAAAALTFWVEHYVGVHSTFGVESPNEKTVALLVKLGYARRDNGTVVGSRGFVVRGGR